MSNTYYIGLDVHKETIAIAYALGGSREDGVYHGTCGGSVPAAERALRKLAKHLEVEFRDLKVCYEAGPTGFVLARRLIRLGLECILMSPSKTERKPNEKIKTDKRDACKIARLFRNGDITEVRIPPALDNHRLPPSLRRLLNRDTQGFATRNFQRYKLHKFLPVGHPH